MSIEKQAFNLLKDKSIATIISKISSSKYDTMPYPHRKQLFNEFNDILSRRLETYLNITFINDNEINKEVTIYYDDGIIVMNGVDKNPYKYLENILSYHLAYKYSLDKGIISVGNVLYDNIYFSEFPGIAFYSKDLYKYKKLSLKVIDDLIKPYTNKYRQEFEDSFDKNISSLSEKYLIEANEILDKTLKINKYDSLFSLQNKMKEMLNKNSLLNIEELALLSIKDFFMGYVDQVSLIEESINIHKSNSQIKKQLEQFIEYFFSEYKDFINISINKGRIYVNKTEINEQNLFIDVVMNKIAKIEDKQNLLKSNLDQYFLARLNLLDSLLENRNLGIINYVSFSKIYKNKGNGDIYKDNYAIFNSLFYDEKFLAIVERYLNSDKINTKELYEIVGSLNKVYYDTDIKLIIDNNERESGSFGSSLENTIFLNIKNNDKISILVTLFHEYRHCMQYMESNLNHGIYNKTLYEVIKKNIYVNPLNSAYSYAQEEACGYINPTFYQMQPLEYDAEYFSDNFMKKLYKSLGLNSNDYKKYLSEEYNVNYKYLSNEKRSLLLYDEFLRIDDVDEENAMEESNYKLLIEQIYRIKDIEDAKKIFSRTNFFDIPINEKIDVFKIIAGNSIPVEVSSNKYVIIDNCKYNYYKLGDYGVLEKIFIAKANLEISKRRLLVSEKDKYIFDWINMFNMSEINKNNLYMVESYCTLYEKYRVSSSKNKPDLKRRKK